MAVSRAGVENYDAKVTAADFTGKLYYICDINGDGLLAISGDGAASVGVVTEEAASGYAATYQFGGIAKVILGATVDEGALVASDSAGKGITATTGEYAIGVCRKGGAANSIGEVLLTFPGRSA
jgi:hypothetical protein